jgi:hypothetical protein
MLYVYNDGGRAAAGYKGKVNDCVCRAIAIATERPYQEIYDELTAIGWMDCAYRIGGDGLAEVRCDTRKSERAYLAELGWMWTPTMHIGSGCQVHLDPNELPKDRLVVSVSRHLTAVIDGVIHDTFDCSRDGSRCIYGYWIKR